MIPLFATLPILGVGREFVEGSVMAKWIFEPGHSAAEFAVRHMMVSHMRGLFKNVHGSIDFDPDRPADAAAVEADRCGGHLDRDDARCALACRGFLDVGVRHQLQPRSSVWGRPFLVAGTRSPRRDPPGGAQGTLSEPLAMPLLEGGKNLGRCPGFVATTAINRQARGS
jgi:hypothetical protein